jgi:hypothetical protein
MKTAVVLISLFYVSTSFAAERNVYMPTQGSNCLDQSRKHEGAWSCRGPGGYLADFSDEGNVAAFAIRQPGRLQKSAAYAFPGRGKVFGDVVDWRVVNAVPVAAVLRVWRAQMQQDGSYHEIQELVVFKVSPQESCPVVSIDARQANANEVARQLADEAAGMPCQNPK